MSDKEIITLLRHKRHDWMNQIQLIQGYASLAKTDKLMEQINEVKEKGEHERRLLNSGAEEFSLWLLSFNWYQKQYRLQYYLGINIDLSSHDNDIMTNCKRMMKIMSQYEIEEELYEGTVHIDQGTTPEKLNVSWEWEGRFAHPNVLQQKLSEEGYIASMLEDNELSIEMMIEIKR